jgi:ATP-dependent DNA helicase RecG
MWCLANPIDLETNFPLLILKSNRLHPGNESGGFLQPVYPVSEKLKSRYIDSKFLSKLVKEILKGAQNQIRETLPAAILQKHQLIDKRSALMAIHFPQSHEQLASARTRLKFEELFYIQLRLIKMKLVRQEKFRGIVFNDATILTRFYNEHLPFPL